MTLFWDRTGPLLTYDNGVVVIRDLNPEIKVVWRMSRWERFRTGWRLMLTAVR